MTLPFVGTLTEDPEKVVFTSVSVVGIEPVAPLLSAVAVIPPVEPTTRMDTVRVPDDEVFDAHRSRSQFPE